MSIEMRAELVEFAPDTNHDAEDDGANLRIQQQLRFRAKQAVV